MSSIRLQKFLAQAGVASRRRCEDLIAAGRVEVDGERELPMGLRIDPQRSIVRVDGQRVLAPTERTYVVVNKPRGIVSSMADEQGRPDLRTLLGAYDERLFHIGRLDTDTSGLLLVSDDGDFAHRLAHPSYEVPKTYVALVRGTVKPAVGKLLRAGIELDDGFAQANRFRIQEVFRGRSLVEMTIHMGRNRIVRRMLAEAGHPVIELTRTAFGPVLLGDLRPGQTRLLTAAERARLFDTVGL